MRVRPNPASYGSLGPLGLRLNPTSPTGPYPHKPQGHQGGAGRKENDGRGGGWGVGGGGNGSTSCLEGHCLGILWQPAPRVGKPGGQRVGERVGDAFYPTWRAGSKFWRLAQNKACYAVLAVQVSFHFAWHSSISAAPKILVFGNFAEFRRLVGPLADFGGGRGGGGGRCSGTGRASALVDRAARAPLKRKQTSGVKLACKAAPSVRASCCLVLGALAQGRIVSSTFPLIRDWNVARKAKRVRCVGPCRRPCGAIPCNVFVCFTI